MATKSATIAIDDPNPAAIYLQTIGSGSRQGMRQALDVIAGILSNSQHDADTFPWAEIRFKHTVKARTALIERYRPASVNKMLAALRGTLKQAWRLGYIDAETYQRAVDIGNVSAKTLLSGRALDADELKHLFGACVADPSPAGRRDAAMLGVFYGAGLRRGEVAGLDVTDYDRDERSLVIRHAKRGKQRIVYLTATAARLVDVWLEVRGTEACPLFVPIDQTGRVRVSRMRGESIAYILRRRQEQAGTATFSPHDLRRSCISDLLTAGVDVLTVQRLAGHAEATTTSRYDRRGETAKRHAAQALEIPAALPMS